MPTPVRVRLSYPTPTTFRGESVRGLPDGQEFIVEAYDAQEFIDSVDEAIRVVLGHDDFVAEYEERLDD